MHSKVDFVPPPPQALTLFFYTCLCTHIIKWLAWAFKWPAVILGLAIQGCAVAVLIHISSDVCG
jgi:uncharacterized integral membrane protein